MLQSARAMRREKNKLMLEFWIKIQHCGITNWTKTTIGKLHTKINPAELFETIWHGPEWCKTTASRLLNSANDHKLHAQQMFESTMTLKQTPKGGSSLPWYKSTDKTCSRPQKHWSIFAETVIIGNDAKLCVWRLHKPAMTWNKWPARMKRLESMPNWGGEPEMSLIYSMMMPHRLQWH